MNTIWDILYLRRPVINYVSPPICEVIFSGSSNPVIILSERTIGKVTGVAIGGFGGFQLTWNAFPGALCYNIYFIGGDNLAVILAQCVPDGPFQLPDDLGPGLIVITPVTLEGEGPPSDPAPLPPTPGGMGVQAVFVTSCPSASRASFPGSFTFHRDFVSGTLLISYTISGTAVNGVDYEAITNTVTFPIGVNEVTVDITPIEAVLLANKFVTVTINESLFYLVSPPASATVHIRKPYLRIKDYGTPAAPLFAVAPAGGVLDKTAAASQGCEWDGTYNYVEMYPPVPGPEFVYYYQDTDGVFTDGVNESVQGTELVQAFLAGPFSGGITRWQIQILGRATDLSYYIIWQGYIPQAVGGGPNGIYQISGTTPNFSDLRATLEIELFP